MSANLPSTVPHRRRVQFTVRTFFGAAVLVSLFAAAANLPGEEAKITAIAFLVWVTVAGLYWTFGGIAPLVALPVGAALAAILLGVTVPLFEITRRDGIWIVVPISFVWGVVFSILAILSRGLRRAILWVDRQLWGRSRGQSPFRQDIPPARSAFGFAGYIVLTRLVLVIAVLVAAAVLDPYAPSIAGVAFALSVYLDMPMAPLVFGILEPTGPGSVHTIAVVIALVAFPLHAGTAWIVGFIAACVDRRRVLAGVAVGSPSPVCPVEDPQAARTK